MKIFVKVNKDRTDLFCDDDEFDISVVKAEIENYYGFKTDYVFDPKENSITFYNKSQIEKLKKLMQEVGT